MRKQITVDLGGGKVAVIHELTVKTVWQLLPLLKTDSDELDLMELIESKWLDVLPVILDNITLPDGIELGFSDFDRMAQAFFEVNAAFFGRASVILGIDLSALAAIWIGKSRDGAMHSQSEGTQMSGTTAGVTS